MTGSIVTLCDLLKTSENLSHHKPRVRILGGLTHHCFGLGKSLSEFLLDRPPLDSSLDPESPGREKKAPAGEDGSCQHLLIYRQLSRVADEDSRRPPQV